MSNRGDPEFLKDIQEAICRIHDYLGSMEYTEFLNDKKPKMRLRAIWKLLVK